MEYLSEWIISGEYGRLCGVLTLCGKSPEQVGVVASRIIKRIGSTGKLVELKKNGLSLEEAHKIAGPLFGSYLKIYVERLQTEGEALNIA